MKPIVIIIVIVVYWFLVGLGLNFLLQDEFLTSAGLQGNATLVIPNTTSINMSTLSVPEQTSLRSFPEALKIMFGFRTPVPAAVPPTLTVILSFLNWFLVILLGISIYRILNPFATP